MKTRSLVLACAATCTLALPTASLAANVGTVTIDWTGSGFSISPTSLPANAGDTVTIRYGVRDGTKIPALYDGTGAFQAVSNGVLCAGTPAVGAGAAASNCTVDSGGPTDTRDLTVLSPGTLQIWLAGPNFSGPDPLALDSKQGEVSIGTAAPAPTPAPAAPAATTTTAAAPAPPPPTAQLLRSPTTQNTKASNRIGCSQVSVPLQLDKVGKYTFIYERSTGQSASARESQATSATRVTWNKGSTLGKRKLTKASTAPVLVTTEANKRLVVNGLIKKAQAKNLRLRVIHRATDGTLTQDVFDA